MVAITINGEPVNAQLEHEKTILDVVNSLERWLGEREQLCTELEIDGALVTQADRLLLLQRPLNSIQSINLVTASFRDVMSESSIEIMRYLARFYSSLREESEEIYTEGALEGLRWVTGSLRLLAAIHLVDLGTFPSTEKPIIKSISTIEEVAAHLKIASDKREGYREILTEAFKSLPDDAYTLLITINKKIENEEDIPARIQKLQQAFKEYTQSAESILADLQTGNEARAMTQIQQTIFLLEELVQLAEKIERGTAIGLDTIMAEGEPFSGWLEKVTETGRDVILAFTEKDTILLGDLFEYEIREALARVPGYLEELLKRLRSQAL